MSRNDDVDDDVDDVVRSGADERPFELDLDLDLFQVVGLAVLRLTPEAVVTFYNSVSERLFGWTGDSGLGRSFADHVVEHPDGTVEESFGSTLSAGRPWAGRVRLPTQDRNQGSAPATALPVQDVAGRVVGAVVLSLDADSALWPLLTGTLDGRLVMHGSGRVTYANQHATRLLGGTGLELQQVNVASPLRPGSEALGSVLARHMSEDDRDAPIELRTVDQAGQSRWIEATITGTNADGPLEGVLWRLRDVTGRRRLDGRQKAQSAELQAALDSRVLIEQAKGFLAGRDGDSPDAAFRRLRRHARDHNLELREVARRMMARELTLSPTR